MADKNSGWLCTATAAVVAETNTTATIEVTCYWKNNNWRYDINFVSAWVYKDGTAQQIMNNGSVDSTSSYTASVKLGSYRFTVNKTTSAQSIPCCAKITSESSYVSGTKWSGDIYVTVAAKPSYTVSYNANGGTGGPGNQTKWHDTNLTLSSSIPSRTGHSFVRWNTNTSNTGTGYAPGATYTGNAGLTLYAIWTPHTYTVQYNANGGTGAPGNQTKTYGVNLTLSSVKPTRTNYNFLGWSTSANGGVVYGSGATYTNNSAVTLYAVWELAYQKPRITNFDAHRCDANGNASETGTYVKVTFNWATDRAVTAVACQGITGSMAEWDTATIAASGTSGTVSEIYGDGNITIETTFYYRVYVSDSGGTTYSSTATVGTVKFPIDVKAGGTGVAFGKVAERDVFEVEMPAEFNNNITFKTKAVKKTLSTPGWYRVAKCSNTGASFIANLYTNYNYTNNSAYVISVSITYEQGTMYLLNGYENTSGVLTYVRLVRDSADRCVYLEVFYNMSVENIVFFEILNYSTEGIHVLNFEPISSTETEFSHIKLTNGMNVSSHSFNQSSWNVPTRGLVTQITDNTKAQHSVIVGLKSDGKSRLYGMDLLDNDASPTMRLYSGNGFFAIENDGSAWCNGLLRSQSNGNTVSIGSQNSGYCHIYNSADIPFYFNKDIMVNGYTLAKIMASNIVGNAGNTSSYVQLGTLKLCWGKINITPVASTPTSGAVTFPLTYSKIPAIIVTAETTSPGAQVKGYAASNITTTGFNAYVNRTNTTVTSIIWFAIGE